MKKDRDKDELEPEYDFARMSGGVQGKYPEAYVTVLAREDDETFTLAPEEETALLEAMAEGDRGEVVSAEEFLGELGKKD